MLSARILRSPTACFWKTTVTQAYPRRAKPMPGGARETPAQAGCDRQDVARRYLQAV
jgi:hypothetical protein